MGYKITHNRMAHETIKICQKCCTAHTYNKHDAFNTEQIQQFMITVTAVLLTNV